MNIEKHVKELTNVVQEMFLSTGSMFQQEHLRFFGLLAVTGGGGHGGGARFPKAIMEHKVIQYLRAVNGDKSLSDNGTTNSPQRLDKSPEDMRR